MLFLLTMSGRHFLIPKAIYFVNSGKPFRSLKWQAVLTVLEYYLKGLNEITLLRAFIFCINH